MALTKVTNSLVAVNAIQGTLIADNAITTVHIVNNAITATQLADNAVTATKIQNGIIATDHLAADLITAAKIADDAISEEHLDATVISSLSTVTANSSDYVMLGDTSDSNNLKKALVSDFAQNEESPTFTGNVQVDGTLGVTGATTLSSTLAVGGNVTGVSNLYVADDIGHTGDSDTYLSWDANNLSIYNGGVQSMYMDASEVVVNNASVDSDFRVESDGNAHMLFVDGGNNRVGIGTSNPVAQLGVGGAGRRIEIEGGDGVIRGYNRSGTAWAGIDFEAASYSFDISGTESVNFNSAGQVTMGGSSHADDVLYLTRSNAGKLLRLYQASTEKTYIGTAVSEFSGSIGIGGITPTTQLHMRTSSSGSYPILMEGDIDNDGGFIGINFGYNGTNYNKAAIHVEGTSGNVQPDMHFLLNSTASSANVQGLTDAKLSILNSGEVGIGTPTPAADLHVYSTSNPEIRVGTDEGSAIAQLAFSDGNGYFLRLGDNANNEDVMIRTYGDTVFNGGDVGIGSTSPEALLHINKSVTGANNQELLKISRVGGATSDSSRRASITFLDASNSTYTGMISGYRDSPAGNYDGGLRFYVNSHSINANAATFSELDNSPGLYLNPNQSINTFGIVYGVAGGFYNEVGGGLQTGTFFKQIEGTGWTDVARINFDNASWGICTMEIKFPHASGSGAMTHVQHTIYGHAAYSGGAVDTTDLDGSGTGYINWVAESNGNIKVQCKTAYATDDAAVRITYEMNHRTSQNLWVEAL